MKLGFHRDQKTKLIFIQHHLIFYIFLNEKVSVFTIKLLMHI